MSKYQKILLTKCMGMLFFFVIVLNIGFILKDKKTITIGTKNLTEQRIVAYMLEYEIEKETSIEVEVLTGLDSSSFLNNALSNGDIDMYVEYSSSSFIEIFGQKYTGQSQAEIIDYIKQAYTEIGAFWYTDLGFNNSNAFICKDFCKDNNIETYSDLTNLDIDFTFGAPAYFYSRSDGFNLVEDAYDMENVIKKSMDPIIIYSAINSGQLDVGLAFTSDAKLANGEYITLEDDLNVFPKYEAGIVIRQDVLKEYPDLESVLDEFERLITTEDIQILNNLVENEGFTAKEVAIDYVDNKI